MCQMQLLAVEDAVARQGPLGLRLAYRSAVHVSKAVEGRADGREIGSIHHIRLPAVPLRKEQLSFPTLGWRGDLSRDAFDLGKDRHDARRELFALVLLTGGSQQPGALHE